MTIDHSVELARKAVMLGFLIGMPVLLTAIVVGVATLGVALSITQMIFKEFGSLEEDEILEIVKGGGVDD